MIFCAALRSSSRKRRGRGRHEVATQIAAGQGKPSLQVAHGGLSEGAYRLDLHYTRASGLAQARLQLAVLSGNRRRALEQIDRLVNIDRQLERMASGDIEPVSSIEEFQAELTDQRLAIASEKLALTSTIELPRLEPAFGAGMGLALDRAEEVEIVESDEIKGRLFHLLLWSTGFLILCLGVAAAAVIQL